MKKLIMMLFAATTFVACEEFENNAEESKITWFPLMNVEGQRNIELGCDATSYTDAGASAREGEAEIEVVTTVTGTYFGGSQVDGPDVYEIAYSATNKDGIPAAEFRRVFWPACNGDLVNSIAGVYTANVVRNGSVNPQYQGLGPIIIRHLGGNQYQLSDAIGGYYDYGRAYGYHYASTGMIVTANNIAANDFTYGEPVEVGDFGGVNEMTSFEVDPATKKINFVTEWDAGYVFEVELTQVPQ